jgi:hypothetical protein
MSVTKKPQKVPNICDPDTQGVHQTGQESWRAFEIMAEFVEATERLKAITPAVSIFGSARTPVDHPYYKLTEEVARLLSESGFSVISGGGPGIMEAANKGAYPGPSPSVGLNIELPHEQTRTHIKTSAKISSISSCVKSCSLNTPMPTWSCQAALALWTK